MICGIPILICNKYYQVGAQERTSGDRGEEKKKMNVSKGKKGLVRKSGKNEN